MRQNLVFFVLLGLFGVLGISLATRERKPHTPITPSASASAAPAGSASAESAPAPSASGAPAAAAAAGLGRVLRVGGSGWEALAPVLLANGGLEPSKESELGKASLQVSVSVARDQDALEAALARGGADEAGADLAVMPLAGLVTSYQKLQALSPVAIYVTAWSRGREAVIARQAWDKLPQTGEVALATSSDPASTFFALFGLELAGVAPSRVRAAERGDAKIHVTAVTRAELKPAEQKDVLLSTAEASRFAPLVLVCPAALIEKHPDVIRSLLEGWLAGAKKLASDPTASARTLSGLKDAPEPIALLARLGELAPVGLGENTELFGLSGRGAVTVESLLTRLWRLGREAKLVTMAAPERAPVASGPLAQLVRADPARAKADAPISTAGAKAKPGTRPLVVVRAPADRDAAESELGFVAGVFPRSPIRVSAPDKKLAESLVKQSAERFAVAEGRLGTGSAAARVGETVIEVLPIP